MIKKTIMYEDFNGDTVTEDYFFHLSKADLIELEMSYSGGLSKYLQNIIASGDGAAIISEFKKLLLMSFGEKSADGKRFVRTQAMKEKFLSSEAYSTLFLELVTDADAAAAFVNGIVSSGSTKTLEDIQTPQTGDVPTETGTDVPYGTRIISKAELIDMDADELKSLIAEGKAVIRG